MKLMKTIDNEKIVSLAIQKLKIDKEIPPGKAWFLFASLVRCANTKESGDDCPQIRNEFIYTIFLANSFLI